MEAPGERPLQLYTNHAVPMAEWVAAHRRDERPADLPYGLDGLDPLGWRLRLPAPPRGLVPRLLTGLGRRYDGLPWGYGVRPPAAHGPTVCWDERSSLPLTLLAGRRPISGVIWFPDRPPDPVERLGLRRLRAAWALTDAQVEPLRRLGVARGRVEYLEFGVEAGFFTPGGDRVEPGHVVCVGTDVHRDYATLLAALRLLRERTSLRPRLTLVTRDPVDVTADLGSRRASLPVAQLRALYRSAAVVVVPCVENLHGSGMTSALEALACRRPVIATATPGMAAYVDPGRTGLLYPPGDAEALAERLERLLGDDRLADRLAHEGRADVEARLNTDALARRLDALVRRVAD